MASGGLKGQRNGKFIIYLLPCLCLCLPAFISAPPPSELPSVSLGRPGPLRSASDLHEQVCQLVWQYAPGPLSDEAGPGAFQRPGVHTEEEIQGHREAITIQSPPTPHHCSMNMRQIGRGGTKRKFWAFTWMEKRICLEESTWGEQERNSCPSLHQALRCFYFPPVFFLFFLGSI